MDISRSIQATVKYSDYFNFPLSPEEIHFWLISPQKVSLKKISSLLPKKKDLSEEKVRSILTESTNEKVIFAQHLIKILKFIPGLRLIALTGSVAAKNSYPDDDIDLFFITSPHALWLVRPIVLFTISLFFRRRHPGEDHSQATNAFCPNLWLDSLSIKVPINKRNLYTAHEVLQIVPLLDRGDTYQSFLFHNSWVKRYLANAYHSLTSTSNSPKSSENRHLRSKSLNLVLVPFNYISYIIQLLYMRPKKTTETVHLHAAYLHTTDFSSKINKHLKTSEAI